MSQEKLLPPGCLRWRVSDEEDQMRLADFLVLKEPSLSATAWRRVIDEQRVWICAKPSMLATARLASGTFIIALPSATEDSWRVLASDEEIAVFYKPAPALFDDIKRHESTFGLGTLYPVHRLDKMTSGLLLMARSAPVASKIEELFRERQIEKSYLAFTWFKPHKSEGVIESKLTREVAQHGGGKVTVAEQSQGMSAVTTWKLLAHQSGISLIECKPMSGRMHQLRAHLQSIGCPVIGDSQYQSPSPLKGWHGNILVRQHMLHAWKLNLGESLSNKVWTAPLSPEFNRLCQWIDPHHQVVGIWE